LSDALSRRGVYFDYYRYDEAGWLPPTPIFQRNRGQIKNTKVFSKCVESPRMCCQIMDGELHRCSFSNNGSRLGLIPRFDTDFVRLDEAGLADKDMRDRILALTHLTTALNACDFCPADEHGLVPAGVQLPR